MATLRTDYTDAVWVGTKKYVISDNGDGSASITDITQYTNKENSFFGAADANAINGALNQKADVPKNVSVSLSPAQWVGSQSPYYQTLTVEGVTSNTQLNLNVSNEILTIMMQSGTTSLYCENNDAVAKVFAMGGKPTSTLNLSITLQEVEV